MNIYPNNMVEGGQQFTRRDFLKTTLGLAVGGVLSSGEAEAAVEKKECKNSDFNDNFLKTEIDRLASNMTAENKSNLLTAKQEIFDEAEKHIINKRLKGVGQEKNIFLPC